MPAQVSEAMPDPGPERAEWFIVHSRYAEAETEARAMIADDPHGWEGHCQLARSLLGQGRANSALPPAREAVRRAPEWAWPRVVYARVLLYAGRHNRALDEADEAASLAPEDPEVYGVLAEVFNYTSRPRDFLWAAREGLRYAPEDLDLIYFRGWAELQLGRTRAARRTAVDGLAHHPDSAELYNLIGVANGTDAEGVIWIVGRCRFHRLAEEAYREAVRLNPAYENARNNRRANLVSWRRVMVAWVYSTLFGGTVVATTAVGFVLGVVGEGEIVRIGATCFGLGVLGLLGWTVAKDLARDVLSVAKDFAPDALLETFLLAAPLRPLGVPTLPLRPLERLKAIALWAVALGFLVLPPLVLVGQCQFPPIPRLR